MSTTIRANLLVGAAALSLFATAGTASAAPSTPLEDLPPGLRQLAELSRDAVARGRGAKGLERRGEPQVLRAFKDADGRGHVHWRATVDGVPVWGGDYIAHLDDAGALTSVTAPRVPVYRQGRELGNSDGSAAIESTPLGTVPMVSEAQALEAARADVAACASCASSAPEADLWVLATEDGPRLAWRVRQFLDEGTNLPTLPVRFVDALDGSILAGYDNLQTAKATKPPARTGSGNSLYSGKVSFADAYLNGKYYLEDLGRRIGTRDSGGEMTTAFDALDGDNSWLAANQAALVDVHWGAQRWYYYMLKVHGRPGITEASTGPGYYATTQPSTKLIDLRAHYGTDYNNAAWTGDYVKFGDGDGTKFSPLVSLDIVAHELTHGAIQYTANLTYSGESGALNESMADVFGALADRHAKGETAATWLIGEQCYTPGVAGDALRSMADPHSVEPYGSNPAFTADDDPDHYTERYVGEGDNGGVHINSGIGNKAFHLLAKGGTHHRGGGLGGIGPDDAGRIWYRALTTYMTSSTNFAGGAIATVEAAADLFGPDSAQAASTRKAWCLVGVGSQCSQADDDPENLLVNGGFENSASPWVLSGSAVHLANGTYPHTGQGYVVLASANKASGQVYQQLIVPTSAAGVLAFWLNVNTQETTTVSANDRLVVELRSTRGALITTLGAYSNLEGSSFRNPYMESRFDISRYRGQMLRVEFRAFNDGTLPTTFRIDDVVVK